MSNQVYKNVDTRERYHGAKPILKVQLQPDQLTVAINANQKILFDVVLFGDTSLLVANAIKIKDAGTYSVELTTSIIDLGGGVNTIYSFVLISTGTPPIEDATRQAIGGLQYTGAVTQNAAYQLSGNHVFTAKVGDIITGYYTTRIMTAKSQGNAGINIPKFTYMQLSKLD